MWPCLTHLGTQWYDTHSHKQTGLCQLPVILKLTIPYNYNNLFHLVQKMCNLTCPVQSLPCKAFFFLTSRTDIVRAQETGGTWTFCICGRCTFFKIFCGEKRLKTTRLPGINNVRSFIHCVKCIINITCRFYTGEPKSRVTFFYFLFKSNLLALFSVLPCLHDWHSWHLSNIVYSFEKEPLSQGLQTVCLCSVQNSFTYSPSKHKRKCSHSQEHG